MAERSVFVKLGVTGGDTAVRDLRAFGAEGERALKRIETASIKPSKGLRALDGATRGLSSSLRSTGAAIRIIDGPLGGVASRFTTMSAAIGGTNIALAAFAIGIGGAVLAGTKIARVASEFEQLRVRLETVTGSTSAATREFDKITKFASSTPFSVQNITKAFITLQAAGIRPTTALLKSFGNTAAAFGGDINQFAEAVRGAITGETERLKQFGIVLRLQADTAQVNFRGRSQQIARDADSIVAALASIGDTDFAGGMERQSMTFGGALNNMGDSLETMFDLLSRRLGLLDALQSGIRGATEAVEDFNDVLRPRTPGQQGAAANAELARLKAELEAILPAGVVERDLAGGFSASRSALAERLASETVPRATIARATERARRSGVAPEILSQQVGDLKRQIAEQQKILDAKREEVRLNALLKRDQEATEKFLAERNALEAEAAKERTILFKIDEQVGRDVEAADKRRATARKQALAQIAQAEDRAARAAVSGIARIEVRRDQEIRRFKTRLDDKLIDEEEFARAVEALTAESEARKSEIIAREEEKRRREAEREAKRQARELDRIVGRSTDRIVDFGADAFDRILAGGKNTFEELGAEIVTIMRRTFAQVAAEAIIRPIIAPIVGNVVGAAPGLFGASPGGGTVGGGFGLPNIPLPGFGGLSAGIDSFGASLGFAPFASTATAGFDAAGFISAGGQFGPAGSALFGGSTLSAALGGIGLGFGAGTLLNSLIGGNSTGGTIGSGIGSIAGFAVGGPIGALVGGAAGGFLGGLFGNNNPSVGPNAGANVAIVNGRAQVVSSGGDNGGDVGAAIALGNQVADGLNKLADALGATLTTGFETQVGSNRGQLFGGAGGALPGSFFGSDANALFETNARRFLRSVSVTGLPAPVEAAIANSTAASLEGLLDDIAFAQAIAGIGEAEEQIVSLGDVAEAVAEQFEDVRERAVSLGIGLGDFDIAVERTKAETIAGLISPIQAFKDALAVGPFAPITPLDRFDTARAGLDELALRAIGGDLGAIGAFPGAAQGVLGLGRDVFASGPGFQELFLDVNRTLDAILALPGAGVGDDLLRVVAEDQFELLTENNSLLSTIIKRLESQESALRTLRADLLNRAS